MSDLSRETVKAAAMANPFDDPQHLANTADAMSRACGASHWQRSTAKYHAAVRDTLRAQSARIAALETELDAARRCPISKEGDQSHPDDKAVDRFAAAMKEKLAKKREQGRHGWESRARCTQAMLSGMLARHVLKGDPVDVANLAMMLHQRDERIAPPVNALAELLREYAGSPDQNEAGKDETFLSDCIEILAVAVEEWNSAHPDEPDEIFTDLRNRARALAGEDGQ